MLPSTIPKCPRLVWISVEKIQAAWWYSSYPWSKHGSRARESPYSRTHPRHCPGTAGVPRHLSALGLDRKASCRARVGQYGYIQVVAGTLQKKQIQAHDI